MINLSTLKRFAGLTVTAAAITIAAGAVTEINAQRDPFRKAGWATPKKAVNTSAKAAKPAAPPVDYGPPAIEARIEYFKRLRGTAAANGQPLPKVTSVLTLGEMSVTGIFKTPRGYAAMVEATPIKLSYTIMPGEKFFDGQLVAVEENRLVFRKVTKVGENKYVASVENKPLRKYTDKAAIQGTAPVEPGSTASPVLTASSTAPATVGGKTAKPASNPFASPLDEMNKQPVVEVEKADKGKKPAKKTSKVAKNDGR